MLKQFFISTILITGLIASSAVAQNMDSRAGDEAALEALYESTNGNNWADNTGWSSSGMSLSDNIYGVETATIDGELRVVSVKLNGTIGWKTQYEVGVDGIVGGNNLSGTLPEELGNLKECLYFNVKQNDISGSIPPEIGKMAKMEHLLLNGNTYDPDMESDDHHPGKAHSSHTARRSNNFTGSIPPELGDLSNCKVIEIIGEHPDNVTGLTGDIPPELGNITTLQGLHLTYNDLTGGIPPELSGLSSLIMIDLSGNEMDGTITSDINNTWTNLKIMRLANNNFTGDFPALTNLNQLQKIIVRHNDFTGNLEWLADVDWNRPIIFMFGFNNFTGSMPDFGSFSTLTTLGFTGNDFTGTIHDNITEFSRAKIINFGWNPDLGGTLPQTGWGNFTGQLRQIRFNNNQITGNISDEMLAAFDNSDLQNAYFSNAEFTGADVEAIANMQHGEVHLSGNRLTFKDFILPNGVIPSNIANYDNQRPFGTEGTRSIATGGSITLDDFDSNLSHPDNNYQWQLNGINISGATSKNLTINSVSLENAGTYTLKVTNSNVSGMTLTSRNIELNVTEGDSNPPNTPSLSSPQNGASDQPITLILDWASADGADDYYLQVSKQNDFSTFSFNQDNLSTTEREISGLDESEEYYWRVQASNQTGNSNWSEIWSFTTENSGSTSLEAPTQIDPSDNSEDVSLTPDFNWSSVDGADSYILHVSGTSPSEMIIEETVDGTTFSPNSSLVDGRIHHWRVRAVKDGVNGEWSPIWEFTTQSSGGGSGTSDSTTISYNEGWNLVSLPRDVSNRQFENIFTDIASSSIYSYEETYTPSSELEPGQGYWIKLLSSQEVVFDGDPISTLKLPLKEGWNLIGGPDSSIDVGSEISDPDNIIEKICRPTGEIDSSCVSVTSLEPGKAYFMKVSDSGNISLN